MKRVFVAEDDAALSRGICMALQSDDLALIPYGTIREARLKARRRRHSGAPSVGEEEGVGIGLYLARQMIAGENGYLEVKSKEGSVFYVCLPAVF